ncbi:unnamed protein product [Peniophora sp. CBMAI 1063]|nr:unnamed protein product [Peniophora sp. CBMAI 1063]
MSPTFVYQIIRETKHGPPNMLVDLGAGVGNVLTLKLHSQRITKRRAPRKAACGTVPCACAAQQRTASNSDLWLSKSAICSLRTVVLTTH